MSLNHPAEEAAQRIENGDDPTPLLTQLSRAELKYVIARATGAWDIEEAETDVFEGEQNVTVTRDELSQLVAFLGNLSADGE